MSWPDVNCANSWTWRRRASAPSGKEGHAVKKHDTVCVSAAYLWTCFFIHQCLSHPRHHCCYCLSSISCQLSSLLVCFLQRGLSWASLSTKFKKFHSEIWRLWSQACKLHKCVECLIYSLTLHKLLWEPEFKIYFIFFPVLGSMLSFHS